MNQTPIRFRAADAFLASARDMGDHTMVDLAMQIWWQVRYPRTKPASDAANEAYAEWKRENGWA
jgi:hypothetical protein